MAEFSEKQLEQLDNIDNTAFDLLKILANENDLEWNMELIGEVVDYATIILLEHGHNVYYPYETEENGEYVIYDLETSPVNKEK